MTGGELQAGIIDACPLYGWKVYHVAIVGGHERRTQCPRCLHWFMRKIKSVLKGDGIGFPDLALAHPVCAHAFVECKGEKEPFRPGQEEWLTVLAGTCDNVAVWRPAHYDAALEWLQRPSLEIPGRWRV